MTRSSSLLALSLALALALPAAPAGADEHHREGHGHGARTRERAEARFGEPQRAAVHAWYADQIRVGHCPPGLAKKRNGCLPPGQAKKRWAIGRPLPREVIFYDLPPTLAVEIGPPPAGYRYARVANDVLLLAIGTGLVLDAITDLGQM